MLEFNINNNISSLSTIWDEVVSYFVPNDKEQKLSRGDENFDAIYPILSKIIDNQQVNTGKHKQRALDFGCGTGILTERLSQLNFDVFGYDTSLEMITQARLLSRSSAVYETGNLDVVLRQSSFRLITMVMVLQFVSDIKALMTVLCEKLEDNGMLFFAVHNVEYVTECVRFGLKFRGFTENSFSATGEIQIGHCWIPIYVRSPEWYNKIFAELGMTQIGYSLSTTPIDVPQLAQNQWKGSKYYMAWFKKI